MALRRTLPRGSGLWIQCLTASIAVLTIIAMKHFGFLLCLFLLPSALYAQDDSTPNVEGYMTAIASGTGFDVNGKHIVTTPQTTFWKHIVLEGRDAMGTDPSIANTLAVGDDVQVFGDKDRHTHSIVASKIILAQDHGRLSGFAVVQRVVATSPQLIVEADGYKIAITPKTSMHNKRPLTGNSAPAANMWIEYSGKGSNDGLVVADRASFSQFVLSSRMKKMMKKADGKIVEPNYGTKPGESKKDGEVDIPYIVTSSHKGKGQIPADATLQQRVQRIGERLVPTCQKDLAKDDPQKIDFHFYAFNDKGLHHAVGSPDGSVVIPEQVVAKLQNDDQIAAVLADGIAQALERQMLTAAPKRASGGAMIAMGAMPFVGPLAGIAMESGGLYAMHNAGEVSQLQSARVSLSLMHDAGYDVHQAPVAWQILSSKDPKATSTKAPSPQATYLLSIIGQEYAHSAGKVVDKHQPVAE